MSEKKEISIEGKTYEALADGEYDVIVMGTGIKECILSGIFSVKGKKVLHVDRNNFYGGASASLNLDNLFKEFGRDKPTDADYKKLGPNRDFNVDLIPKFLMSCGNLVKILLHTKVTRYLDFKVVDGSYVYRGKKRSVAKVPTTGGEALASPLMGFFQKRKLRNFLLWVEKVGDVEGKFVAVDPKNPKINITKQTMRDVYTYFGLDDNTQSFIGHALCLERDDAYLDKPAKDAIGAAKLYAYSMQKYGKSPYLYPVYGLGGLPEGFSRLCAVYGGTFMLNQPIDNVIYNEKGEAVGVHASGQAAKAKIIIGDASYFPPEKVEKKRQVARKICLLDHPIPGTSDAQSCQIIMPASQIKDAGFPDRKSDIYVSVVSFAHMVAPSKPKKMWIAIISTTVETGNPQKELQPADVLIGKTLEEFYSVSDYVEPKQNGNGSFISKSFDGTSHFESVSQDVLDMYESITGEKMDMTIKADLDKDE